MGYDANPSGPVLPIVTVVLQYGVFPTLDDALVTKGSISPPTKKGHDTRLEVYSIAAVISILNLVSSATSCSIFLVKCILVLMRHHH